MTEPDETQSTDTNSTRKKRERVAEAFGNDIDPLAQYISTFESLDTDSLQIFLEDIIYERGLSGSRVIRSSLTKSLSLSAD